jgi:hypothetical protein
MCFIFYDYENPPAAGDFENSEKLREIPFREIAKQNKKKENFIGNLRMAVFWGFGKEFIEGGKLPSK